MPLGNSEAVKQANEREAKTRTRRAPEGNPATETAAVARPEAPERSEAPLTKPSAEEEFEARLLLSFPDLPKEALDDLKKLFLKK